MVCYVSSELAVTRLLCVCLVVHVADDSLHQSITPATRWMDRADNDGDGAPTVIPSSRLERAMLTWLPVTYTIHLTWELGYLLLHDAIARSPDAAWSYAWWAYVCSCFRCPRVTCGFAR